MQAPLHRSSCPFQSTPSASHSGGLRAFFRHAQQAQARRVDPLYGGARWLHSLNTTSPIEGSALAQRPTSPRPPMQPMRACVPGWLTAWAGEKRAAHEAWYRAHCMDRGGKLGSPRRVGKERRQTASTRPAAAAPPHGRLRLLGR
eukprot:365760-Chlamydomonas_euryale.AAC.2